MSDAFKIAWIEQGVLAASGIPVSQSDLESLSVEGVRAIVTLTEHPLTALREITPDVLERLDIECLHVPINDQYPPRSAQIVETMAFIEQMRSEARPVFIHCFAGVGRTGTMLHAYFLHQGHSLEEAKQLVKLAKPTSQWLMLSDAQKAFLTRYALTLSQVSESQK